MSSANDLDRQRFRFVLATVGLLLAASVVEWWLHTGWKAITLHTAVILGLYVAWAWRRRDALMARWLVFAVAAGFAELVADAYMVQSTGSLVYYPGPRLWASPAYMPFAWAMVLIQLGFIADHLARRWSLPRAIVATALLGGVNIPVYEHLAAGARWWYYHHTPMIGGAPFYIILAEALLVVPLPWVALRLRRTAPGQAGWGQAAVLGVVVEGLAMLVAVLVAWWLLGPCDGAVLQLPCTDLG